MQLFLMFAFLFSLVVSAILGIRLLRAGMRTRTAPELTYGSALVLSGIGSVVRVIVYGIVGASDETRGAMVFASVFAIGTLLVLSTGIRIIYRPNAMWPYALQAALVVIAFTGTYHVATGPVVPGSQPFSQMLNDVASSLLMLWGSIEAFSYWGRMKKRLAIGLVDPVVTDQFRLWGLGFGISFLASMSIYMTPILTGVSVLQSKPVAISVNILLVVMTVVTWAAFYPPKRYQQWVRARHAAAVAA